MQQAQTCLDKQALIEDIRDAMNRVISINNREMEAVLRGDFARLKPLKSELMEARTWKDSLLEEYYRHLREHGC
ncbi:MAG TPA: hypothetical protein VGF16_03275 [Bryobacteraceae bacterium]